MTDATRAGLVLAGGRSRRFGESDKATATVGGQSLLRRAATGLAPAVDQLVISCRADQCEQFRDLLAGVDPRPTLVTDPVDDRGPLAGLVAGAAAVEAPYLAVVAGDQPFVAPRTVTRLFERFDGDTEPFGVLATVDGDPDPTHAVYRTAAVRRAGRELLASDTRSLRALVDALGRVEGVSVPDGGAPPTFDVDTPADWRRARRMTSDGDPPVVREVER